MVAGNVNTVYYGISADKLAWDLNEGGVISGGLAVMDVLRSSVHLYLRQYAIISSSM